MIYAGLKPESEGGATDATRRMHGFWSLAGTGLATSIDAMVVGVGLAFLDVNIGVVALVIGLTTLVMVTFSIMRPHTWQSRGKACGDRRWLYVDRDRRRDFARAPVGLDAESALGRKALVVARKFRHCLSDEIQTSSRDIT